MQQTIVLPYVSEEPKRERPFTPEMEKAAILCLLESKRRKPKILRGAAEEVDYVVKLHYPLWGIPWKDRCIVVDGLGLSSATSPSSRIPDVVDFTEELKEGSVSSHLFLETLKKHGGTFRVSASMKEEVFESIVGKGSVLESLSSLIGQAENPEEQSECDVLLVPPRFPREEAERKAESFIAEFQRSQTEVEALQYAIEVLKEETEHHKEKIQMEIELIWRDYEERIHEMKKPIAYMIKQITREKGKETQRAAETQEKSMKRVLMGEKRLRQKIEKLRRSLEEHRKRRRILRIQYPKRSTARIDSSIKLCQEKVKDLTGEVRALARSKETISREANEILRGIEQKYLNMATKEMEKLEILEQSRNIETSEKRAVTRDIDEVSSVIEAQVKQLVERKIEAMKTLEEKTISIKVTETMLIGIPFYLVQFKLPQKARIDIRPPVTATSYEGTIRKIQRTTLSFNLEVRIQSLLSPRSPELDEEIFARFKKILDTDSALRDEISEIGKSRNLLQHPNFKEEALKGMGKLEDEGWLKAKERENILSAYIK